MRCMGAHTCTCRAPTLHGFWHARPPDTCNQKCCTCACLPAPAGQRLPGDHPSPDAQATGGGPAQGTGVYNLNRVCLRVQGCQWRRFSAKHRSVHNDVLQLVSSFCVAVSDAWLRHRSVYPWYGICRDGELSKSIQYNIWIGHRGLQLLSVTLILVRAGMCSYTNAEHSFVDLGKVCLPGTPARGTIATVPDLPSSASGAC
jgi:hypothetical protein